MAKLDIKDIVDWIINNTDDQRAMDTISNLVFPHTTRYKSRYDTHSSSHEVTSTGSDED